jgi:hypothetical protein
MSYTEPKPKPKPKPNSLFNNFQDAVMNYNTPNVNTTKTNTKGVPSMTSWSSKLASVFTKKPTETEEERKKKEENQRKKSRELYNKEQIKRQIERQQREIENARRLRSPALLGRNIAIKEGKINEAKRLSNYLVNKAVEKRKNVNFNKLRENRNTKDNKNKNYILNKLESNDYDLLYNLINNLFDAGLSEESKEKFQEYLSKEENLDKKRHIMKILKSVYRLKYNKSIEKERKERIIENAKSLKGIKQVISTNTKIQEKIKNNKNKSEKHTSELENQLQSELKIYKNRLLLNVEDISSSMDLATSFHNFSKKTYYICNAKQLKKNYTTQNIRDLSEKQIEELSPLYYVNGICCFNPLLRTYVNNAKGLKEGLKQETLKNNSSNTGVKIVEIKPNNKNNFIDIDSMIADIEKYNDKNSLLSKFFDKHILGIANEYGIQENNRKNNGSEINSKNFDRFCDEFGSFIDTIVVVENGQIKFIHTKTQKSDGTKILAKYFSNKQNGGGNIQAGGFEPLTLLALLAICIPLFCSLIACYNNQDRGNTTIIKIVDYSFCVVLTTFVYILGFIFLVGIGVLTGGLIFQGAGMSGLGSGSGKTFRVRSNYVMTSENALKVGLISGKNIKDEPSKKNTIHFLIEDLNGIEDNKKEIFKKYVRESIKQDNNLNTIIKTLASSKPLTNIQISKMKEYLRKKYKEKFDISLP